MLPGASRGIEKKQKTGSYQFRFLLRVEAFRGGDGRCFRFPVLTVGGRVKGLGGKVLPGSGSYPRWKGLGLGAEGASGVGRVTKKTAHTSPGP